MHGVPLLLFLVGGALTSALCCDWLLQYHHLSAESRSNLRLMGGELSTHDGPAPVPYRLYSRIRNATLQDQLLFIRNSLNLISGLFNHSSVPWDAERFLVSLHRQLDELDACVRVSTETRVDVKLKKYYKRLFRSSVTRCGGSRASWDLVREQSILNLEQLDLLVSFILRTRL